MPLFSARITKRKSAPAALALLLAAALLMPAPARAASSSVSAPAAAPNLSRRDEATVKAAEKYLSSLVTLQARFVQTANDGSKMTGDFMLKRPGRMRFQYDPPSTDFIVADGTFIYYYDGEMKQQSNALISHSLANFFLRKDLSLSGDITVVHVGHRDGMAQIRLVQTKEPKSGALTLVMSEKPMTLQGWRVVDASGATTEVALTNQMTGIALDGGLFHYYDPKRQKEHLNK
ncbi:MAG: outer membrane lipoprotein carrier protein LolA [Alphaproteobacteria bacterium]|nr:outer membrane lipoprotein carrier protein LolA [Alphaproteobacteria bacterium]